MAILGVILSLVLIVVSAVHLLWAFGYWFPIRDEAALVRAAVGMRGAERMPGPIPCALVCVALLFVTSALWWPQGQARGVILAAAALIFAGRGLFAYSAVWRRLTPQEPFATYDRRYYGPLCLTLGLGILIVLLGSAA